MIPDGILQEMKTAYSIFIAENVKEEKTKYYYDLINSIPNDLFHSKDPRKLMKAGKKLSCFLFSIEKELKADGCDLKPLEENVKDIVKRYKNMMQKGVWL